MKIFSNEEIINSNEYLLHDYEFLTLEYKSNEKQLIMQARSEISNEIKPIIFEETINFEARMCDYWGPSPYIYNWEACARKRGAIRERILLEAQENGYRIDCIENFMEICIVLSSGNKIVIVCQRVIIQDVN